MPLLTITNDTIYNSTGTILFSRPRPDCSLVLGSTDRQSKYFICGQSEYEATNYIYILSLTDGTIVHKLELPFCLYIDGKEPPKWCLDDAGIVIAILGDPDDESADPEVQSFYLWSFKENRLYRLKGRGYFYHSKFTVKENLLYYEKKDGVFESTIIDKTGKEIKIE